MSESLNIAPEGPKGKASSISERLMGRKKLLLGAAIGNNVLFFGGLTALTIGIMHGNVPLAWAGGLAAAAAFSVSASVATPRLLEVMDEMS